MALRIIRQPKPLITASTGGGTGPTVTPPANQTSMYDVRLPIFTGNAIGIDCCATTRPVAFHSSVDSSDVTWAWSPALLDNAPARSPDVTESSSQLLINADIEPDTDADGYGDETQDLCPTDATTQGSCPQPQPPPGALGGPTGQRAAALKRCKKTAKKKHWTKKQLKKCKTKASLLPV